MARFAQVNESGVLVNLIEAEPYFIAQRKQLAELDKLVDSVAIGLAKNGKFAASDLELYVSIADDSTCKVGDIFNKEKNVFVPVAASGLKEK